MMMMVVTVLMVVMVVRHERKAISAARSLATGFAASSRRSASVGNALELCVWDGER
jgi:hypothetical protein